MRTLLSVKDGMTSELITEDEKLIGLTTQNVDKTINYVKELRDNPVGKEFRHCAEVPMVIWEKSIQEGWNNDSSAWKKWLNDPDNKIFRTWQGKV